MGQADDHVDLTFGLTFQPCSRLSLALATHHLIKVTHTRGKGVGTGDEEAGKGNGKDRGRKIRRTVIITPHA